jgi:hypothetical protein
MRFLGKYELLEQLTVGSVETFVAYPIGGGERLLIHVFALPALIKSDLKNSDLLAYMETMSPPALGALLDAGRYDDGTQAFLVTKFPRDPSLLANWIEAYKSTLRKQDTTTAEAPARQVWGGEGVDSQYAATSEVPIGDFTRAFQGAVPTPSVAPPDLASANLRSSSPQPTQVFSTETIRTEAPPAPSKPARPAGGLGEGAQLSRSSFFVESTTKESESAPATTHSINWDTQADSVPAVEQGSKTAAAGEFTNFFKSPFAAPSNVPDRLMEQESSPRQVSEPGEGEFTRIFGGSKARAGALDQPEPLLESAGRSEDFTNIFGKAAPSGSSATDHSTESSLNFPESAPSQTAVPPVVQMKGGPVFATGAVLGGSTLGGGQSEGATRLFRPPVQDAPVIEKPPSESEYTRIVSAKSKPSEQEQKALPEKAPAAFEMPKLPGASLPHLSPVPAVPALHIPPPVPHVHLQTPPIPQAAKVAAILSTAPKAVKKPGKWATYAPLIVILNLILVAALSLLLYFVLKR